MTSAYLLAHFETTGGRVRYLGSRIHGANAHGLTTTEPNRCVLDVLEGTGADYEEAIQNLHDRLELVPELAVFKPDEHWNPGDDEAGWRSRYEQLHRAVRAYLAVSTDDTPAALEAREVMLGLLVTSGKMRWDMVCLSLFERKSDALSTATMEAFREIVFRRSSNEISGEAYRWANGEKAFLTDPDTILGSVVVAFEAGRIWEREHR